MLDYRPGGFLSKQLAEGVPLVVLQGRLDVPVFLCREGDGGKRESFFKGVISFRVGTEAWMS